MSLYEGEKGVTIVYGSMYGNTGKVAEIIATRLCERGIKNIKIHNVSKSDLSFILADAFRYKGLVIGCPTYNGTIFPGVATFMSAIENRELKNRVTATFGSHTWASAACKNITNCLVRMKMDPVDIMDMKQAPGSDDYEKACGLADKLADKLLTD